MMQKYYYDHAANSPLLPEVKAVMLDLMGKSTAGELTNASSLHQSGHRASLVLENARATVAKLINAEPSEIIFTSGGTESNNTVMHIFEGQQIITSDIEHPSILEAAKVYRGEGKQKLYSFMLANNEIGTIFPVKELAQKAHNERAFFHTDATQALGKLEINVKDLDVDYLTASAHKIGGPIGVGILYVKNGAPYKPLLLGGHQEHGRRAGTTPIINIAGFAAAAEFVLKQQTWRVYEEKIRPLRNLLRDRIIAEIPHATINSPKDGLPNILNVSFAAAEGESIQLYLDLEGSIEASTGSACASGDGKPSHVLMATTGDIERAHSSIRFSFGLDATEADVDHIMKILPPIIKRLQGISTIKISDERQQND